MGERTTYGRSHDKNISRDPEFDAFGDEATGSRGQSYRFGRATRGGEYPSEESMPMFLSGYEDEEEQHHNVHMQMREPDELEYDDHWSPRPRRTSVSSRILLAVVAAAAVAVLFALVTSDATRDLVATAKASIIGATPDPTAPQPTGTQLTARDLQLNEPARLPPAPVLPELSKPVQTASAAPSREEIANAYQSALQNRAAVEPMVTTAPEPAAPSVAPVATAPASITAPGAATAIVTPTFATPSVNAPLPQQQQAVRRMDPDELAGIMKRAKSLLASGDIPPARLLLERAADAQEPAAALMLAQTYDAQVLGTRDVRNINADPNTARNWYRRAAQLGSSEAQRRLNQLQN
jgi:hypothetical protein